MRIVIATAILVGLSLPAYAANDVIVSGDYELVKDSDDFGVYKDAFAKAASKLIASGKCTAGDFKEIGGWRKSTNYLSKPIYFTYCGGLRIGNKIYLDAATGEVMR